MNDRYICAVVSRKGSIFRGAATSSRCKKDGGGMSSAPRLCVADRCGLRRGCGEARSSWTRPPASAVTPALKKGDVDCAVNKCSGCTAVAGRESPGVAVLGRWS